MRRFFIAGALILCSIGLGIVEHRLWRADAQTASLLQAVETTFPQPSEVTWSGRISRIFVSGIEIEVVSPDAPGGVFHAITSDDTTSPIIEGEVTVRGSWDGWTCDYGTRCVPNVVIESITAK